MLLLLLATVAIASVQAQWGGHQPAPSWVAPPTWNVVAASNPWASPYSVPVHQHQPATTPPPPPSTTTPPATVIKQINPDGSSTHGYQTHDGQTRTESFGPDGSVRGSYSYTDPSGKPITVNYIADRHGFRASGDHIPAGTGHGPAAAPVAAAPAPAVYRAPVVPTYQQFPVYQQAAAPATYQQVGAAAPPIASYSFNSGLGVTGLYGRK